MVRCNVSMLVTAQGDTSSLTGQTNVGDILAFDRWPGGGASLRYLDVTAGRDQWVRQWSSSIVPPAALALIVNGDTIVLPVAGR